MSYPEDSYLKIFCKTSLLDSVKRAKLEWFYTNRFSEKEICITTKYMDGSDEELAKHFGLDFEQIIAIKRDKPEPPLDLDDDLEDDLEDDLDDDGEITEIDGKEYRLDDHQLTVTMKLDVAKEKYMYLSDVEYAVNNPPLSDDLGNQKIDGIWQKVYSDPYFEKDKDGNEIIKFTQYEHIDVETEESCGLDPWIEDCRIKQEDIIDIS